MEKTYGKKAQYKYFEVQEEQTGRWYPRALSVSIADQIIERWDKAGINHRKITEEKYNNYHSNIDF